MKNHIFKKRSIIIFLVILLSTLFTISFVGRAFSVTWSNFGQAIAPNIAWVAESNRYNVMAFTVPAGDTYYISSATTIVNRFTLSSANSYDLILFNDAGGQPSAPGSQTVLATIAVTPTATSTVTFVPSTQVHLQPGATYYISIKASTGNSGTISQPDPRTVQPSGGGFIAGPRFYTSDGTTWTSGPYNNEALHLSITFDTVVSASTNSFRFTDGRINHSDTGNPVVLYGVNYGDDEFGLEIYNADESGLLFTVSPELIAVVEECPAENTLIAENVALNISFWRLAGSCQFQVNTPSSDGSKTYVIIFNELFSDSGYNSFEE